MRADSYDRTRALAVRGLQRILIKDEFSNDVLAYLVKTPGLTDIDRKFLTALVYGTLDYLPLIDEVIKTNSRLDFEKIDSDILMILRISIWQIYFATKVPKASAVDEAVNLTKHVRKSYASGFVNAVLRNAIKKPIQLKKKQEHLKYGLSSELFGLFKKWYGEEEAKKIAASFIDSERHGLSVLLPSDQNVEQWIQECAQKQIIVQKGYLHDKAYIMQNVAMPIEQVPGFSEGAIYFQDEAAMLVSKTLFLTEGTKILDACAGLGGKSFAFLAENKSLAITALEPNEHRFTGLIKNIKRLSLANVKANQNDLETYYQKHKKEKFDLVLLDVPCSGLGVLKHKPEIKLKTDYQSIQHFPVLQEKLLREGSLMLNKKGILVYSTCTLNPAENQEVISSFLASEAGKDFVSIKMDFILNHCNASYRPLLKRGIDHTGLLIRPDYLPIDGFFISCLRRK